MHTNDSIVTITYQYDENKPYYPFPFHSIRCYDQKGHEIQPIPTGPANYGDIMQTRQFTPEELADTYANLDLDTITETVNYTFEAWNVQKVVLQVFTDEEIVKKTLHRP